MGMNIKGTIDLTIPYQLLKQWLIVKVCAI